MRTVIGTPFTDTNNGTWTMFLDAVEPYNRVTCATYVIGISCNNMPLNTYARANNYRVIAIVPGRRAPNNLFAVLIPIMSMFKAAHKDGNVKTFEHTPYLDCLLGDRMAAIKITCVKGPGAYCSFHYCKNQAKTYPGNIWRPAVTHAPDPELHRR